MPGGDTSPTRQRILTEAMRLFGEQGYSATTIAEIEAAAGLSPGAGSLYRHFPSKRALLGAGVDRQIATGSDLVALIGDQAAFAVLPLPERLAVIARAGLRRLDQERDLNRLLVRDLARFPDLLERMGDGEIRRVYRVVTQWLATQAGPQAPQRDWEALAAVLIAAVSNYWLLRDVFGEHPTGIDEQRYVAALVELAAGLFDAGADTEKEEDMSTGTTGAGAGTTGERTTGERTTGTGARARPVLPRQAHGSVLAVTALAGASALAAGVWALAAPRSFASFVAFPYSQHFLHDVGAFQVGIGATLLLAMAWRDALALALAGFLVGNTVHAVVHAVDLDIGGSGWEVWSLAAWSLVVGVALVLRLGQLGGVVGEVTTATTPVLAPFVRQKTVLLTSYRRDGTPVGAPVSIAVDGDRAFIRSPEKGGKVKRMRSNPVVEVAPSTARGKPAGPAIRARARRLSGAEFEHASRLLVRKYPFLQGLLVPLVHRVLHSKTGGTVHFELTPLDGLDTLRDRAAP